MDQRTFYTVDHNSFKSISKHQTAEKARYPGVTIRSNPNLSSHMNNITNDNNTSARPGSDCRLYLPQVIIYNANDCHPNPDPRAPKFPCQVCSKACKWSKKKRSIACNNCELWFLTDCLKMNSAIYDALNNTDSSWYCCNCGIPNFNPSLIENFPFQDNSMATPTTPSGLHSFISDSLSIGSPKLTSSPKKKQPKPL